MFGLIHKLFFWYGRRVTQTTPADIVTLRDQKTLQFESELALLVETGYEQVILNDPFLRPVLRMQQVTNITRDSAPFVLRIQHVTILDVE